VLLEVESSTDAVDHASKVHVIKVERRAAIA
jgi:hypothetical protein